MNLSGAIGISILKKKNIYFIIFYDEHSNINYCKNKMYFISDFFKLIDTKNTKFFIEDYKDNFDENLIWNYSNIQHLDELGKLINQVREKNNWFFTDIRLFIKNNLDNLDYLFNITKKSKIKELIKIKNIIFKSFYFKNFYNFYLNLKKNI